MIKRRQFLKQSALVGVTLSASEPSPTALSRAILQRRGSPKKVIIIGAGLAGLSAAYELARSGQAVTILEAKTRAGGRVHTIREPFSDGLYAEAGAQFVPESHTLTMKYIKLFNLPLVPSVPSKRASIYYIRGRRITVREGDEADWPMELTSEERKLGLGGMMKKYVESALHRVGDAAAHDWPPDPLKKYDRMTMTEFLREQGASEGAIALFRMGYLEINGDGIDSYSALSGLRDLVLGHAEREYKIKGGSDLLPKAFAARLADRIQYGSPVVKIDHSAKEVRVTFLQAGSHQTIIADHLICAIPFPTLKRIEVSPRFSSSKQEAIEQLPYTSVTRVYMQSRKKFWMNEKVSGEVYLDKPRIDLFPLGHTGKRDIYESFITGASSREITAMKEGKRLDYVIEHAQKVLPDMRQNFEGGTSKCWDEDEWARGAWAWYRPGQMTSLFSQIRRAEGRIHFAGEHTSAWPGWMQGALESGNRVAKEVNDK